MTNTIANEMPTAANVQADSRTLSADEIGAVAGGLNLSSHFAIDLNSLLLNNTIAGWADKLKATLHTALPRF